MIEVRGKARYEWTHGKKPRGYGRWAFYLGDDYQFLGTPFFFTGTFTEACKQAKELAKREGYRVITVGT